MIKRILKIASFFLIILLVALAITEIVGRRVYRYDIAWVKDPDHRPPPNTLENNSDGLRIEKEPEDFKKEDLNIIILGDSFVYGYGQYRETSLPYLFEQLALSKNPDCTINAANFGWTSSSPYLSLRLLKDIGKKYSPDVVFLFVDMTDFHDDLLYKNLIEKPTLMYKGLSYFPGAIIMAKKNLAKKAQKYEWVRELHDYFFSMPFDNYVFVKKPLKETEKFAEVILKSIREIAAFTKGELNAKFVLVIFPRCFQYSDKESPKNWERHYYQVLGPYSLEPFALFDKFKETVNFPVYSLLSDFQNTNVFPTTMYDDPHWTEKGHRLVAERTYDISEELAIFPCGNSTSLSNDADADSLESHPRH